MPKAKVAVTMDADLLTAVDALVREKRFAHRSQVIEAAISEHLARLGRTRLTEACAFLNPDEERALAEEGLALDADAWPAEVREDVAFVRVIQAGETSGLVSRDEVFRALERRTPGARRS